MSIPGRVGLPARPSESTGRHAGIRGGGVSTYVLDLPARGAGAAWRFAASPGWSRRIGIIGIALIVLAAICAPLLTPYSPTQPDFREALQPPSWSHPFGTDQLGRDVYTRVLFASRVDL